MYLIKVFLERVFVILWKFTPCLFLLSALPLMMFLCSGIFISLLLLAVIFIYKTYSWLSVLFSHMTTKILTINFSVIACSLEKNMKHIYHKSVLETICLHIQMTDALVKNWCLQHQFRSHRRMRVSLSLWPELQGPLFLVLRLVNVLVPRYNKRVTLCLQTLIGFELHYQTSAFSSQLTNIHWVPTMCLIDPRVLKR